MALPSPLRAFQTAWREWTALFILFLIVGMILFPIFAQADGRPYGVVRDAYNRPVRSGTLSFRDTRTGGIVARFDLRHPLRWRGLREVRTGRYAPVEFAFAHYMHATGAGGSYVFSPLAEYTFWFLDTAGKPIPDVSVAIQYSRGRTPHSRWQALNGRGISAMRTDSYGAIHFSDLPANSDARYFQVSVPGPGQTVLRRERHVTDTGAIEVRVTVGPPGG